MKQTVAAFTALAMAAVPAVAFAQIFRGRVTDYPSGRSITGVQIDLIDDRGRGIVQTTTDTAGFFELRAPRSGVYSVRAALIGYQTLTSEPLEAGPREILELSLQLSVRPVSLTPVVVRVRPDRGSRLAEFEQRRTRHEAGHFITRPDIERRPVATASELLVGIPGVNLTPQVNYIVPTDRYIISLRGSLGACQAHVFINGAEVSQGPTSTVDDLLIPEWLAGVEVYPTAASTPVEYRRPSGCGAVLFWTREPERGGTWRWTRLVAAAGFLGAAIMLTR